MRSYNKKKICIVSSTRADFGILSQFIKALHKEKSINLKFIVTGSHLEKKFGFTLKEIKKEKILVSKKIKVLSKKNDSLSLLHNSSKIISKFSKEFKKINPDLIILLGDRYETFCIAYCAYLLRIPIAHLYGGELTRNSLDDSMRHSITKLSNYHFVSTQYYKKRVLQLGEDPKKVFNVGSLSLDKLEKIEILSRKQIEQKLNIVFEKKIVLFTLHPETNNLSNVKKQIITCLKAFNKIDKTTIIMTMPNDDLGSDTITREILKFCKFKKNCFFFKSLGRVLYFSLLKSADLMIGNSSSGIIEAPSFGTHSINLGDRQLGRIMAKSTYNSKFEVKKIIKLANMILKKKKRKINNPYYKKNSIDNIISILKRMNLSKEPKKFFDLKHGKN